MSIRTSLAFVLTLGLLLPAARPTAAQERIPAPREESELIAAPQEEVVDPALPSDLALVPADAPLFITVRVADVWHSKAGRYFSQNPEFLAAFQTSLTPFGLTLSNLERFTFVQSKEGPVCLFRMKKPPVRSKVVKATAPHAERTSLKGKSCYINEETWSGVVWVDSQTLAFGSIPALDDLLAASADKGPFQKALNEAAGDWHLAVAVKPAWLARIPGDFFANTAALVRGAGLAETVRLLKEAECLVLTAQLDGRELHLAGWATYASSHEAARGVKVFQAARQALAKWLPTLCQDYGPGEGDSLSQKYGAAMRRLVRASTVALKDSTIKREEKAVTTAATVRTADVVLGLEGWLGIDWSNFDSEAEPLAVPARLGRLGQAMLDYHKKHGRLPGPAICDKDGKPLLSWRVALLPFLGETELYKRFRLDEPWDSEHNRKLISRMPTVFSQKDDDETPTTVFQVFAGKGTAFDSKKGRQLSEFKDGPEQTILIAQAARAVPWTKPEDISYSSTRSLAAFGLGAWPCVVLADGQVIELPGVPSSAGRKKGKEKLYEGRGRLSGLSDKNLRALITRAGSDQAEAQALLKRCQAARTTTPPAELQPASFQSVPGGVPMPLLPPLPPPPPFPQAPQPPRMFISAPMLLPAPLPSPPQPAEFGPPQPREDQPH